MVCNSRSDALYFSPSGTKFKQEVTLQLGLKGLVSSDKRLAIHKYNNWTMEWDEQAGSVADPTTKQVRVQTLSFSTYAIFQQPASVSTLPPGEPEQESSRIRTWQIILIVVCVCVFVAALMLLVCATRTSQKAALELEKTKRDAGLLAPVVINEPDSLTSSGRSVAARLEAGNPTQGMDTSHRVEPVDEMDRLPLPVHVEEEGIDEQHPRLDLLAAEARRQAGLKGAQPRPMPENEPRLDLFQFHQARTPSAVHRSVQNRRHFVDDTIRPGASLYASLPPEPITAPVRVNHVSYAAAFRDDVDHSISPVFFPTHLPSASDSIHCTPDVLEPSVAPGSNDHVSYHTFGV